MHASTFPRSTLEAANFLQHNNHFHSFFLWCGNRRILRKNPASHSEESWRWVDIRKIYTQTWPFQWMTSPYNLRRDEIYISCVFFHYICVNWCLRRLPFLQLMIHCQCLMHFLLFVLFQGLDDDIQACIRGLWQRNVGTFQQWWQKCTIWPNRENVWQTSS